MTRPDREDIEQVRELQKLANTQSELLSRAEPMLVERLRKLNLNHNPSSIFNNYEDDIKEAKSLLNDIRLLNGKETNGKFKV